MTQTPHITPDGVQMPDAISHKRLWFSPHGTEWEAESYEEALEMERDSLVEQLETLRGVLATVAKNGEHGIVSVIDPSLLSNPASSPEFRMTCGCTPHLGHRDGCSQHPAYSGKSKPSP